MNFNLQFLPLYSHKREGLDDSSAPAKWDKESERFHNCTTFCSLIHYDCGDFPLSDHPELFNYWLRKFLVQNAPNQSQQRLRLLDQSGDRDIDYKL